MEESFVNICVIYCEYQSFQYMCVCVFCTFCLWYLTVVLIGMFLIAANTKIPCPPPPEDTDSSYIFLFEVTIKSFTTLKNLGCLFTAIVGAI